MCFKHLVLCSVYLMTKVSSTYFPLFGRVSYSVDDLSLNPFHEQVGNNGSDGRSHSCTIDLLIILTLEEETCVFETELQKCDDIVYAQGCSLLWSSVSFSNLLLKIEITRSTGTDVNKAFTQ